jgi:3-oxoacyl-[acyl-carrier-protein] synthase-3
MIGITDIASYLPSGRLSNHARKVDLNITDEFIVDKLGMTELAIRGPGEETSDLCVKAYERLKAKGSAPARVDALILVTQNPDYNIPHSSAIVHGKLDLNSDCACFDISLGCSGFVYALSVVESFMQANGFRNALLFTADPYSKIVDPKDKNTVLLFGDGAAVTLLTDHPVFAAGPYVFGTLGKDHAELICRNGSLYMNGRAIFNFAAKTVPGSVTECLAKAGLGKDDIDRFLFHQGSKFIVDTLTKRLELPPEKVPFVAGTYGNTVSSSIPMMVEAELAGDSRRLILCGFGVGLSWATTILTRR